MKIQFKILAATLLSGLLATPAFAQEYDGGRPYVALNVGRGIINKGCAAGLVNCTDNKAYAYFATYGFQFTPNWALEASYGKAGSVSSTNLGIMALTLGVSGVATVHMSDTLAVFAKAGLTCGDFRVSGTVPAAYTVNPSGYSPSGGVGIQFDFTPHLSLRVQGDYLGAYGVLAGAPRVKMVAGTAGLMWAY